MNDENEFTCQFENCFKFYKDPIFLPCGYSICKEHIPNDINEFYCQFCRNKHVKPKNGFPLAKSLMQVMHSNRYLNDDQLQIKSLIDKLETINDELNSIASDPHYFLLSYFSVIKNKINKDRLQAKSDIDEIFDNYINKVNAHEQECTNNLKNLHSLEEMLAKNNAKLEKLKEDFRIPDVVQVKELLGQANKNVRLNEMKLESLKNDLLCGRTCHFESKKFEFLPEYFGEQYFEAGRFVSNKLSDEFGTCLKSFHGHEDYVECIKSLENSNILISVSRDKNIKIWDIFNAQCMVSIEQDSELFALCLIPLTTKFITGSKFGYVKIWNINDTSRCLNSIQLQSAVYSLCLLPNNRLACGIQNRFVAVHHVTSLKFLNELMGNNKTALCLKSVEKKLVAGYLNGLIEIWDANKLKNFQILQGHSDAIFALDCSYDNSLLFSGSYDGNVKMWDMEKGNCLHRIYFGQKVNAVKMISNEFLAIGVATLSDNLIIFDMAKNEIFETLKGHENSVRNFEVLPNGDFVSCSKDCSIKMWQI